MTIDWSQLKTAEQLALERAPGPDWRGFLEALRDTTVFAALRSQARVNVEANALATELRAALGEAALGLVDMDTIQGLLNELLPTLPPEQIAEIQGGIAAFNIPLTSGA